MIDNDINRKRPDLMQERISAAELAADYRKRAMVICAKNAENADEALLFMQMLGLVDEHGDIVHPGNSNLFSNTEPRTLPGRNFSRGGTISCGREHSQWVH